MLTRSSNTWYALPRLREEVDRLFTDFLETVPGVAGAFGVRGGFPALNVWEDGTTLYAEAEVPGLRMEDIAVFVLGNELTIKGERKAPAEEGTAYHRRERGVGPFSRVLRLPIDVDAERVEADLNSGVLTIKLPKAQAALPRKIEVRG